MSTRGSRRKRVSSASTGSASSFGLKNLSCAASSLIMLIFHSRGNRRVRKPQFDDEATIGRISRFRMAAVQRHDPRGDRQAEANSAAGPVPCFVDAIEGFEDAAEIALGDSRAMIADGNDRPAGIHARGYLHLASDRRKTNSVANNIVYGPPKQLRIADR